MWQPEIVQNPDPMENYDLDINVPQTISNPLETLTNKRLQNELTYTISNLMENPTNNAGITKESTIVVDIDGYPPVSSQKILNLVQNTVTPITIYPPTGEYWNSIRYSVNVATKESIVLNDIKYNGNSIGFNRRPVNWTFNVSPGTDVFNIGFLLYKLQNGNYELLVETVSSL